MCGCFFYLSIFFLYKFIFFKKNTHTPDPGSLLTAAADGPLAGVRGPEAEEYNYLAYTRSSRGLAGWCNSDRLGRGGDGGSPGGGSPGGSAAAAGDSQWRVDTDEDAAFVAAAAQAHALFAGGSIDGLTELVLRKQGGTAVFARQLHGAETFFQKRRGAGAPPPGGLAAALLQGGPPRVRGRVFI